MFRVQYNFPLMLYTTWDLCLGPSVVHASMLVEGFPRAYMAGGALWFGRSQHAKQNKLPSLIHRYSNLTREDGGSNI
jgi:hypothetical protein